MGSVLSGSEISTQITAIKALQQELVDSCFRIFPVVDADSYIVVYFNIHTMRLEVQVLDKKFYAKSQYDFTPAECIAFGQTATKIEKLGEGSLLVESDEKALKLFQEAFATKAESDNYKKFD